jgi:lysophospholipase L1-like esterase
MAVIVCFGDSNTYGYDHGPDGRLAKDVRWPGVLAAELGGTVEVIEEGLNGRTTLWDDPFKDGVNARPYLLPCLRSHAPVDLVVLMLGTNDAKTIFGRSAPEIAAGVRTLVLLARGSGTGPGGGPPGVLVVAPPLVGQVTLESEIWGFGEARAKTERFGELYRALADGEPGVAFLDAAPLVEPDPVDGVHLAPEGHAILGRAVAAAVRGLL